MKKCPTCDKTFEDSMRFCQIDGTPLVDDAPAFDPFATIVGVAPPKTEPSTEPAEAPFAAQPEESGMIAEPEEVLDLPEADPLKTMYVSDDEMRSAMESSTPSSSQIEIMPIEESGEQTSSEDQGAGDSASGDQVAETSEEPAQTPEPEPPSFTVPNVPAPNFGEMSPPPSPFSTGSAADIPVSPPSFDMGSEEPKAFNEAETVIQPGYPNPFEAAPEPAKTADAEPEWKPQPVVEASAPVEQWTPPAAETNWDNQQMVNNEPFQTPMATTGSGGQNKTLPIISLVLGILSLCCYVSPVTGLGAIITGYLGMKNANESPNEYGGKGLAIAGMVLGGLMLLIGLAYWIFLLFFGGMAMIMDAAR